MCGILGIYTPQVAPEMPACLRAALDALSHRGPDDRGQTVDAMANGTLGLGHTRLAIIDLSPGGHQPMHGASQRFTVVFNGEIYNYRELRDELQALGYRFSTDSDTEVLLTCWEAWGEDCLPRLQGMFAFAIVDRDRQTLTCVRDAFGIKPLFYRWDGARFAFASELPALFKLLGDRPQANLQKAYEYLVFGYYDDQDSSFFQHVSGLRPGHSLTIALGTERSTLKRWWWPSIAERNDLPYEKAAQHLREVFLKNIRLHLRSDVPLGFALSGGVDSSAVVCAARYLYPDLPIHTFSFIAPGTSVSEEPWVDLVNGAVNATAHKIVIDPEELALDLDDMVLSQGEPFGSTSIYAQYRVFRAAREQGVTVMLDGQGADELLAGYHGYPAARLRSLVEHGSTAELVAFMHRWSGWPGRSHRQAAVALGSVLLPSPLRRWARGWLGRDFHPPWLRLEVLADRGGALQAPSFDRTAEGKGRRLAEQLRSALTGQGLQPLLRHGDRNSMRWSIESRVPFLTTDLAELTLALPEDYLLSSQGETKRIFKTAMRGIVPDDILDRRDKIGFQTPERQWLNVLRPQIADWMAIAPSIPLLNADLCQQEINAILDGDEELNWQAWRLINYCRWAQVFNVQFDRCI
ncbi:asparagine synthase (glutamine-hydrolyzing) [Nodosilinea sp. PGN35]|uniref:asparagine synthase (glutamine-hydrolyzing) n=1 Tax=Nodosilinea sp. PGN35 TaxID=3020489 RepID=UPI0023B21542|nr:asparagine synthase (glutamine-hydrolyzing) [Nodosilinea sp. TSF1-S3]MDF0364666.1 asparagine synthase (glutamine-hydrolyzing) [Nodosilinea sp. TSF1-S3]